MKINEKMKELRTQLHLSQDYVAKYLGVSRSTVTQMENGNRKILAEDEEELREDYPGIRLIIAGEDEMKESVQ